jgi:hypothetical protein
MNSDWTPRERVHLLLLAERNAHELREPQRFLDTLRQRLLAEECRPASPLRKTHSQGRRPDDG